MNRPVSGTAVYHESPSGNDHSSDLVDSTQSRMAIPKHGQVGLCSVLCLGVGAVQSSIAQLCASNNHDADPMSWVLRGRKTGPRARGSELPRFTLLDDANWMSH